MGTSVNRIMYKYINLELCRPFHSWLWLYFANEVCDCRRYTTPVYVDTRASIIRGADVILHDKSNRIVEVIFKKRISLSLSLRLASYCTRGQMTLVHSASEFGPQRNELLASILRYFVSWNTFLSLVGTVTRFLTERPGNQCFIPAVLVFFLLSIVSNPA
jgi:hypothetical protein